jgi:hypothetical protein
MNAHAFFFNYFILPLLQVENQYLKRLWPTKANKSSFWLFMFLGQHNVHVKQVGNNKLYAWKLFPQSLAGELI